MLEIGSYSNFYLSFFDYFIVNTLGFKHYGRYVDDFYIIDKDKKRLLESVDKIKNKLMEREVTLHPKKFYLQHYKMGVSFIGHYIKPNRIYIGNRTSDSVAPTKEI